MQLPIRIPANRSLVGTVLDAIIVTAIPQGQLGSWARPTGMPIFDF